MSPSTLTPVLLIVAFVAIDLWVYVDAARHAETGRPVVVSIGRLEVRTAPAWFLGCLFLWIVFFPLYAIARGRAE